MKKRKISNYGHDEVLYKYIKSIYRGDRDETQYVDDILCATRTVHTDILDYFLNNLAKVLFKYEGGQKCISLLTFHLKSINVPLDIRKKIAKEAFDEKKRVLQIIWDSSNSFLHFDKKFGNVAYQNYRATRLKQFIQRFLH